MGDIISSGDKYKRIIKIAEGWLRKKLGASVEDVHKDMMICGNPAFARIAMAVNKAADEIKETYQQKTVRNYGELFLWILYKDTAYRDIAIWLLWQLLNNGEELKKELEPYLKDPEDWYVNSWHESKKHTKEMHKKGEIPKHGKALDEMIFTPPAQEKMLKRYEKK